MGVVKIPLTDEQRRMLKPVKAQIKATAGSATIGQVFWFKDGAWLHVTVLPPDMAEQVQRITMQF